MWFSEKAVKVFYIQPINKAHKRGIYRTSLVFLCLRICLSMEGTWLQCQMQEAPAFCKATHRKAELLKLHPPELVACSKRIRPKENPVHCSEERPRRPATRAQEQWRPRTAINQPIKCKKQPDNQTSRRGHCRPRSLNIDPSPLDKMKH